MKKIILSLFVCSSLFAQEVQEESRVVKTSELELLLFKVGFQSLLTDVDITKDKSIQNEENIKDLKDKVKIIMDEVYKDKRLLVEKDSNLTVDKSIKTKEISELREEIELLKSEIRSLKTRKIIKEKSTNLVINKAIINTNNSNVREKPNYNSKIMYNLNKDVLVELKSCNKYDWCEIKVNNKSGFIAKFLLNL
ncbi:SH3 domain-containing protein [Arcobacter roscoffensis]|uniref:SH3 domain-containing protein n=1 Tax=Arcobacter roscoffensis TaxID=2961520 RepID=A0ABY5E2M4_9BACT|nr:SH3 domain-containing protein [Arcobacter roscoffensis]UTJ05757.1 SH3 domain-containing protein [Arcobacter roscoffensis]